MKEFSEREKKKYSKKYSTEGFWNKIGKLAKRCGMTGVYAALVLYYVLQKDDIKAKDKMLITAALGYFILPIDLIPDFIPVVGLTDDIAALIFAVGKVAFYIDKEVKDKAKKKLGEWFKLGEQDYQNLDKAIKG